MALYDPVGPREEWPELIWRFVEQADAYGGRAAFYQVRSDSLPLYLDAGLKIMKLGEEALVPLAGFDLGELIKRLISSSLIASRREESSRPNCSTAARRCSTDRFAASSRSWNMIRPASPIKTPAGTRIAKRNRRICRLWRVTRIEPNCRYCMASAREVVMELSGIGDLSTRESRCCRCTHPLPPRSANDHQAKSR